MREEHQSREEWEQSIRDRQKWLTPSDQLRAGWIGPSGGGPRPIRTPGELLRLSLGLLLTAAGALVVVLAVAAKHVAGIERDVSGGTLVVAVGLGAGCAVAGIAVMWRTFFR